MRERVIESYFKKQCEAEGWTVLKFTPTGSNGWADRIVFAPPGVTGFAEAKKIGKDLEPLQKIRQRELRALGFICERVITRIDVFLFIKLMKDEIRRRS